MKSNRFRQVWRKVGNYLSNSEKICFELTKKDTAVLKAFSIILVVFHNYWHHVFGAPGENEQSFSSAVIGRVWDALLNNPFDFIHPLTSFFGHYGVHMFIFLSGYGLTKKLISNKSQNTSWCLLDLYKGTVLKQVLKIIKLLLVGLLFLYLIRATQSGNFSIPGKAFWTDFLLFCTFTQNFRPNQLYFFCSVWWFLSLIVQLYFLFPFLVKAIEKSPEKSLFALLLLTFLCGIVNEAIIKHFQVYIFSTPLAQALIFAFGIYCAMGHKIQKIFFWLALFVFPLSWRFNVFFPFSFICIVLISLVLYQRFQSSLNVPWLVYIGQLSMFIYITHGDIRWPLLRVVNQARDLYVAYAMFFGYVFFAMLVAWLCRSVSYSLRLLK